MELKEELKNRKEVVERLDFELQAKNREHFRSFWLHMIILSSAIFIGILPILGSESSLIKLPALAEIGLLIIMIICLFTVFYFQNVLSREKFLISDQIQFHQRTFSQQEKLLDQAIRNKRTEEEIRRFFEGSKKDASDEEKQIIVGHLLGGKFVRIRLLIDKHFNHFIIVGFASGILLIVLSFVLDRT